MPQFIDYDMITDSVYWLNQTVILKFIVKLASKNKEGNRNSFHNEYMYGSNYNNVSQAASIKRSFDYYLTLDNIHNKDMYIQIRPQNIIMLQNVLNQIVNQLFDESLWGIKNKRLIIKGQPQPLFINNLPMEKWLSLQIIVIEYNNQFDKGVRLTLSDESQYIDMTIDNFMGLVYTINSMNLYQCALSVVNYLQRPQFGTNMIIFDNDKQSKPSYEGDAYAKNNRTIQQAKQQKSFFDKVDKLG